MPRIKSNGKQDFLKIPMITRSKLRENFFYRVAEMSNTLARSNNLPSYDLFQEPVILKKNLNLSLVDKLQTFKFSIYPESWFLSLFY